MHTNTLGSWKGSVASLAVLLSGWLTAPVVVAAPPAASAAAPAAAPPLADRLPADVVAYVGWSGTGVVGPNFAASDLGRILADPEVARLLPGLGKQVADNLAGSLSPTNKAALAEPIAEVLKVLRARPAAVVLRDANGRSAATLVMDLGEAAGPRETLEKIVAALVARADDKKPETLTHGKLSYQRAEDAIGPIEWAFVAGRYFAVARGREALPPVLDAIAGVEKTARLADDRDFQRVMARVRVPEMVLTAYAALPEKADSNGVDIPSVNQLLPLHSPAAERRARWEKKEKAAEKRTTEDAKTVEEKKLDPDEKKEELKPDEKKPADPKPEDKKPEEKKPEEKKPERLSLAGGSADELGLVAAGPAPGSAAAPGKKEDSEVPETKSDVPETKSDVPERADKPAKSTVTLLPPYATRRVGAVRRLGYGLGFADGNLKAAVWLDGAKLTRPAGPAPERIDAELLALLPPDTEWFAAGGAGVDLVNAMELCALSPGPFNAPFVSRADWPKRFRAATGLNWKTDIADHLGRGVIFNSPGLGGRWFSGVVLLIEVRNYAALKKSEAKLVEFFAAKYAEKPAKPKENEEFFEQREKLRPTQRGEGPYTVHSLAAQPRWGGRATLPSWALTEEFVVVGLYPQAVRGMLRRLSEDRPKTLAERPEFRELLTRQSEGGGGAVLLGGTDSQRLATCLTGLILYFQTALRGEAADEMPLLDVRSDSIPGLDLITPKLRPTVGALTVGPDGMLHTTVGSLPGVSEFGLTVGVGMVLALMPDDGLRAAFGLPNRWAGGRGGAVDDESDDDGDAPKKDPVKKVGVDKDAPPVAPKAEPPPEKK